MRPCRICSVVSDEKCSDNALRHNLADDFQTSIPDKLDEILLKLDHLSASVFTRFAAPATPRALAGLQTPGGTSPSNVTQNCCQESTLESSMSPRFVHSHFAEAETNNMEAETNNMETSAAERSERSISKSSARLRNPDAAMDKMQSDAYDSKGLAKRLKREAIAKMAASGFKVAASESPLPTDIARQTPGFHLAAAGDSPIASVDPCGQQVPEESSIDSLKSGMQMWGARRSNTPYYPSFGEHAQLDQAEYDVSMYYSQTGVAQSIARNQYFFAVTMGLICANAGYLGVDADHNKASSVVEADVPFIICEYVFTVFFTVELAVRFAAFQKKRDCLRDSWFRFDTFLVGFSIVECAILPALSLIGSFGSTDAPTGALRLVRLFRLTRVVRLMKVFPELVTMIKGLAAGLRAVGASLLLQFTLVYVFAIAMHALLKEDETVYMYWGTVGRSMMTLTANGTFQDSMGIVMRGIATNVPALSLFLLFVLLGAVTLSNMLIGVLCEVVSEMTLAEREAAALSKLKGTLLVMLKRLDADGSGDISKDELLGLLHDDAALDVLHELKIDLEYLVHLLDMIYADEADCHTVPEIMQLLLNHQGDRHVTFNDLATAVMAADFSSTQRLNTIEQHLAAIASEVAIESSTRHGHRPQLANGPSPDACRTAANIAQQLKYQLAA